MAKLRRLLRRLSFPIRCLLTMGMTPRQLRVQFFALSDLGKAFEEPIEIADFAAVMAMDSHVVIWTPELRLALNYTDTRGLALQVKREPDGEWEEVYREQSHQVFRGAWTEIIHELPSIVLKCRVYQASRLYAGGSLEAQA